MRAALRLGSVTNDLPDGLKWRENEGNMCKTMVRVTYLPNRMDGLKHMFYPILLVKRGPPLLTLFGSKIDSVMGTALSSLDPSYDSWWGSSETDAKDWWLSHPPNKMRKSMRIILQTPVLK